MLILSMSQHIKDCITICTVQMRKVLRKTGFPIRKIKSYTTYDYFKAICVHKQGWVLSEYDRRKKEKELD
jgi:N-acyl-L-homoserine lactone synthetase